MVIGASIESASNPFVRPVSYGHWLERRRAACPHHRARKVVCVTERQRLGAWFDILLLGGLGVAAVVTVSGSEQPDLDAWRWLVAAVMTIGAFAYLAVLRGRSRT
jgi:hypothetical protein